MRNAMHDISDWGKEIVSETIRGVSYRIYASRPRRVEQLLSHADRWGDRAHVVQGGRVLTFAALRRAVAAKGAELAAQGIGTGDRVFILGWNSPEWIVNFWACLQLDAIPVLANGWWSPAELADALDRLKPAITLADRGGAVKMPAGARLGNWGPAPKDPDGEATPRGPGSQDENAPATIIFTSGTEGRPKAVVLSHRSLLAGIQMILHITRRLPHQVTDESGEPALHTGPLFHIGGVQTLLRAVMVGDTLVMPEGKFDPAEALRMIEAHSVARWSAVPTMVTRVLEHPDVSTRRLESLKSLTVGGAPVHVELLARIREMLPSVQARIPTGYGLSENGGQATAASGGDTAAKPGSAGRPLPCVEVRIDPRPGLPDGEICIRAPTQMLGYSDTVGSPIDAEGWLHTGDLGHLDEDGHLWITGRSKDVIIRGGENIAPVAIEQVLMAVPGVVEVAVIGIPHPDLGEEVMAFVYADRNLTDETLVAALKDKVASFAVPSRWHIQDEPLPTNHAGKIDKAALIAEMRRKLATA
jgi:acyl-CoA synthetase (AMP-forming)/AMP-acid ligase II